MCGRAYETYTAAELADLTGSGAATTLDWLTPNYNLTPTETSPVILAKWVFSSKKYSSFPLDLPPITWSVKNCQRFSGFELIFSTTVSQ